jgi:DNA-nicking Smr family endonuclease
MLWRESNRNTTRIRPDMPLVEPVVDAPLSPQPRGMAPSVGAAPMAPAAAPKRNARPLPALSKREAAKRFKPHPVIEATLDLHGASKTEAYGQVIQFITRQHRLGHRHVVIITGKGRGNAVGVLRAALPDWLNEPDLRAVISTVTHARPEKGGDGVTHVLLKRL